MDARAAVSVGLSPERRACRSFEGPPTMRWHTALLGLIVGTATASCAFLLDFEELQKGDEKPTSIALKELPSGFAKALCERAERCLGPVLPSALGDEDCVELLRLQLSDSVFAKLEDLPATDFAYHPDRVQACFDALRAAECDTFFTFPEACELAIVGKVGVGGMCTHPAECTRGLYCQINGPCPGSCQPRPPAGQPCVNGACLEGLNCDDTLGCVVPVPFDGECGGPTHPNCALDLHCLGGTADKTGVCKRIAEVFVGGEGFACSLKAGPLCVAGLACELLSLEEITDGSLDGKCVPEIQPLAPCRIGVPDPCTVNHYCKTKDAFSVDGACSALPSKGACAKDAVATTQCHTKFRCITVSDDGSSSDACVTLVPLGIGCSEDAACYSGNCESGTCAPPNFCKLPPG